MTGYSDLKLLAEAATRGPWKAQYPNAGQRGCEVAGADGLNQICADLGPANSLYIAAANPAAVLALIAENERIKARLCVCRDCAGQGEIYSGSDSYQVHFQPPEPDMDVCGTCGGDGVLGPVEDFESLAAERDQLKADNEALRRGMKGDYDLDAWLEWAREAQTLRKDAKRYRWLKDKKSDPSIVSSSEKYAKYFFEFMLCEDRLDSVIDAAMSKKS